MHPIKPHTFTWEMRVAALMTSGFIGLACGSSGGESVGVSSAALSRDGGDGCPDSAPDDGTACPENGLTCSWGTDPRFGCRTQAICENDGNGLLWEIGTASCPEPPPVCPKKAPNPTSDAGVFHQTKCTKKELGLTCVYDEVAYTCTRCSGTLCQSDPTWSVTDLAAHCPTDVPNLGAACTKEGLDCDYNECADSQFYDLWAYGVGMRCTTGTWQGAAAPCL